MVDTSSGHVAVSTVVQSAKTSIIDLFLGAEPIVQFILLLLLGVSIWVWGIIFSKVIELQQLNKRSRLFEKRFWHVQSLTELQQWMSDSREPFSRMCQVALQELERTKEGIDHLSHGQCQALLHRMDKHMGGVYQKTHFQLNRGINFLATVGSAAPFVGLFGTVWGIMHSFQSIALLKNTSLAVVAPGIAEALLATALGLVAAIPATVAYNRLTSKVSAYLMRLERFADELLLIIERDLSKGD